MRPCWMVYQLLLMFVLEGGMNEEYFWNIGFNSDKLESYSVETDLQIDFNPSAVWAFVPARSCHLHLSGPHGTFSPPIFYGNIHVNLWCNWTIMAAPERHIVIYITGFQTNKSCSENHDEIIFEGVSSSVENTIVYACWNKHTHVFATKALAVSVVLLWRSFANTGSNRYFYGRYYVFNDPVLGPNIDSGNCSLVSKQNVSTSAVIQPPIPDEKPTTKSHLDSVFPESKSSEMFRSIPYTPEPSYPQVPPTVMETYISTPTNDHLLTTTTHRDDMLHVTRSLSQTLSTMYYSSESPVMIQSLELGLLEDHTVMPTVGDLEPSHIGKWETMSQSTWTTAGSEFSSETPSLLSAQNTEFLEAADLDVISWMMETEMFSEDRSAIVQTQSLITPWESSFGPVDATDPLNPLFIHILNTDYPEPSLLSDTSYSREIRTTKLTETSQLGIDQTTDQVNISYFSNVQAVELPKSLNVSVVNSLVLPENIPFNFSRYIEPTLSKVSTVQDIYSTKMNPLIVPDNTVLSEVNKLTFTNNGDLTDTYHFSILPTIGQSGFLTVDGAHQQMLVDKLQLTTNVQSHPEAPASEHPWKVASLVPTPDPDSSKISHLQSTTLTETHISVLHGHTDPSSPQSLEVKVDEQLMIESTVASHPTPEISTELTYHKNMLEFTEITDKMETIDEYTIVRDLETQSLPTIDHKYTQSLVEPMEELDWWTVTGNLEATDSISTTSTHPLSTPPSYLYFSRELRNTFSNAPEDIKPQVTPSPNSPQTAHNLKSSMDITTRGLISEGNEKSTYSYQTSSDLDFYQNAAGQPRGGYLDEQDVIYFFDNESRLGVLHKPGDSLYVITTEIEDKDVVWKGSEEDLVQSISEKITERMIYYPSGANSLMLKENRRSNVNKVKLTFWLQLFQGGKEMRNFLKTQLKALEGYPFGSSNATLISYTVDDLNECQLGIENCHSNAHCVNTVGSYSCVCMDGYEDHSPDASGTSCIAAKPAEINSLSEQLEIVIGAIVTVAVTLLFIIITLSVVQYKRRAKVNFSLQDPPTREPETHVGGDHHGELGQPLSNPYRSLSPTRVREHHTARDTSSTLELTKITVEQAAC
ncbi:uncharacterized protein LOC143804407 [Ranitomeya variabilis]|uniref:uncharacterized protein LOC143804407 n=1 Tax=Ranitomeya variabilis TaxID=490064 RepID=UPI004055C4F8